MGEDAYGVHEEVLVVHHGNLRSYGSLPVSHHRRQTCVQERIRRQPEH